ncbi:MAG: peptide chain release factor 1 [Deferribacteres bacterium]|nr:peptide chain release factor 1 [candidate division KSB1 bacterium]MCB9503998.1 peptide chain release factor 1 [Deferribacteres bacterium]
MLEKFEKFEERFKELNGLLSDPAIISNPTKLKNVAKEHSDLEAILKVFSAYKKTISAIHEAESIIADDDDQELVEMAESEIAESRKKLPGYEEKLKLFLVPKDPNDSKNAVMEIRAGTGGDEAGLFTGELYRMYSRYAEQKGWKVEILSSNPQGIGGFKEIIALVSGVDVYGGLKYEGGVHRVQRVPQTEQSGRIHTSAVTVAVLPEADEVDFAIDAKDLKVDVYRSSGPGGQSVNTTDSAVRITHLPTGVVVTCQDEKSQHKNKAKALSVLRSRLLDAKLEEENKKIAENRRKMVSTGDRSAKIRTYNFPQGRMTDHRINLTLYRLHEIMDGDLEEIIDKLSTEDKNIQLQETEA